MATKKMGGLGKGLSALITDSTSEFSQEQQAKESDVLLIDINKIAPNPNQPRKVFEDDKIEELAASIRQHGVIQPILVQSVKNGYEIIAGERRWRASRKAGLREIPCIIKILSEKDFLLVSLIENLQRENLNSLEESQAYQYMIDQFSLTQEEIARNVGKSRPYVANSLRLQKLPQKIKDYLIQGHLSAGHARALLSIEDEKKQLLFADEIIKNELSVRQTEELLKQGLKTKKKKLTPQFTQIESDLKDSIGAKVKIKENNNRGTIQLSFYSKDELERLLELLFSLRNKGI